MSQSLSPSAALGTPTTPAPTTYGGVYPARVYSNSDPTQSGQIQMYIPQLFGKRPVKIWAPPCMANGTIPDVGSVVWCLFQGGDPAYPVYIPPFPAP